MDLNSVSLTGRATRDVEVRTTTSGMTIATISLAVSKNKEEANFFDVICFDKTADIVSQYVQKGRQLAVQGRLQQSTWKDKETGKKRSKVEVVANQVKLLGSKDDSGSASQSAPSSDFAPEDIDDKPIDLSKIPF